MTLLGNLFDYMNYAEYGEFIERDTTTLTLKRKSCLELM